MADTFLSNEKQDYLRDYKEETTYYDFGEIDQKIRELVESEKEHREWEWRQWLIASSCNSCFSVLQTCFSDISAWWVQAYPIIERIATVTGAITGAATFATAPIIFINWVRNKLQERKNKDEYIWVKLILSQDEWTVSSLSEQLDLSEDDIKKYLKALDINGIRRKCYMYQQTILRNYETSKYKKQF